jgi:hypothetical protein
MMRPRTIFIILLIWCAELFVQTAGAADTRQPATSSYQSQVSAIAFQTVVPEFGKHPERMEKGGIVNATFRLDRQGRVKDLKVFSTKPNRWAEMTATRMILAAKFPAPPEKVIAEQGHDWVDVHAQWGFEFEPFASKKIAAAKNPLRFDGLYCCTRQSEIGPATFYLRFYPDGVVLSVVSTGSPRDVARWLNRDKEQSFRYSMKSTSLHLEDQNGEMTFVYSGTVHPGSLTMRVDGYDTATKKYRGTVERTYKFVPSAMRP